MNPTGSVPLGRRVASVRSRSTRGVSLESLPAVDLIERLDPVPFAVQVVIERRRFVPVGTTNTPGADN